jgi:hypothetical protein
MDDTADFFSTGHLRLLNIAMWAKYMAWSALVLYFLWAGMQVVQLITTKDGGNFAGPTAMSLSTMLKVDPLGLLGQLAGMSATALKGIIYFLVLKGISLGLNMIVETDINYREKGEMTE